MLNWPPYSRVFFSACLLSDSIQQLERASYIGEITDYPGVRVLEFLQDERRIWLIWSYDGFDHTILQPEAIGGVWDAFGNTEITSGNSLTVTHKPLYIQ